MDSETFITFPAIRGSQAKKEYYVAMWSLKLLTQITSFDEEGLPPELRAQRTLNKSRIPEISNYILNNEEGYVLSALTVSINTKTEFEPMPGQDKIGMLRVPFEAKFIINDGQHRRKAIIEAIKKKPELSNESIAVVIFTNVDLERCQQMFSDLNSNSVKASRSLGLLYDHRNDKAKLAKLVIMKSEIFRDIVDMERSSLAKRSRKLFTLSAFYNACADLINGKATGNLIEDADMVREFWEETAKQFPAWIKVKEGHLPASEIRESYLHTHGIILQAIGKAGNTLLKTCPDTWKKKLKALKNIDWARSNAELWEGRAIIGGKVSKATTNVTLATNIIKKTLNLPLSEEQNKVESAYAKRLKQDR